MSIFLYQNISGSLNLTGSANILSGSLNILTGSLSGSLVSLTSTTANQLTINYDSSHKLQFNVDSSGNGSMSTTGKLALSAGDGRIQITNQIYGQLTANQVACGNGSATNLFDVANYIAGGNWGMCFLNGGGTLGAFFVVFKDGNSDYSVTALSTRSTGAAPTFDYNGSIVRITQHEGSTINCDVHMLTIRGPADGGI